MPPVVAAIPVAIAAAGAAGISAGIAGATWAAVGSAALIAGASSLAIGSAANLLMGGSHALSPVGNSSPLKLNFSMAGDESRAWGYGFCSSPGTIKYWKVTGTDNKVLWLVCAYHDTPIDSIESFSVNGSTISFTSNDATTSPYSGFMSRYDKLGAIGQSAETNLDSADAAWTTNHRLDGIAYYVWKLTYDLTVYPTGLPEPLVLFKARKIWDPRLDDEYGGTGSHDRDDETTWEWSNNAALCLLDYLLGVKLDDTFIGGCKCPIGMIDIPSFVAAANSCDEDVDLDAGGNENRYTICGMVGSLEDKQSVVESMLQAMAGFLVVENGKLKLYAGVASTATVTLTDDDLAGSLSVHPSRSFGEKVNIVTSVRYERTAKEGAADVPPLRVQDYIDDDGGVELERELRHRFTDSNARAQRINKIILGNEREQLTIEALFKPKALQIGLFDTFTWTGATAGYTSQKMRLMEREIQPDGSVRIVARQETDAKYTWAESTEEQAAPSFQTNAGSVVGITATTLIEKVSSLPGSGNFEGRLVYLTTDDKVYRYTGSAWIVTTAAGDISGQLITSQLTDLSVTTPKINDDAVTTKGLTQISYTITDADIGGWNVIGTVNITATGLPVAVTAMPVCGPGSVDNGVMSGVVSLAIDGSQVGGEQAWSQPFGSGTSGQLAFGWSHTPSAGSHTYTVRVWRFTGGSPLDDNDYAASGPIQVIEFKK